MENQEGRTVTSPAHSICSGGGALPGEDAGGRGLLDPRAGLFPAITSGHSDLFG